jgi:hypothetical protein
MAGWRWVGPGRPTAAEVAALRRAIKRGDLPPSGTFSRGKLGPSGGAAARQYERFHWGDRPTRLHRVRLPDFSGGLYELGKLRAVEYETRKGGERAIWVHKFSKPFPSLTGTPKGRLGPIVGGAAIVTERGIEK